MQRSSNGPYSFIFFGTKFSIRRDMINSILLQQVCTSTFHNLRDTYSSIQLQGACTFDKIYETLPMCIHSLTSRLEVLRIT